MILVVMSLKDCFFAMDDGIMNVYVHYLLVDPDYHGKTIGRTLVNMVKRK